jgi:hypothetical protein
VCYTVSETNRTASRTTDPGGNTVASTTITVEGLTLKTASYRRYFVVRVLEAAPNTPVWSKKLRDYVKNDLPRRLVLEYRTDNIATARAKASKSKGLFIFDRVEGKVV